MYKMELLLPRKGSDGVPIPKDLIGMPPNDEFQIIIGMDIICAGDFSISNFRENTILSFRMHSQEPLTFDVDGKNTLNLD